MYTTMDIIDITVDIIDTTMECTDSGIAWFTMEFKKHTNIFTSAKKTMIQEMWKKLVPQLELHYKYKNMKNIEQYLAQSYLKSKKSL